MNQPITQPLTSWKSLDPDQKLLVANKHQQKDQSASELALVLCEAGYSGVTRNAIIGLSSRNPGKLQLSGRKGHTPKVKPKPVRIPPPKRVPVKKLPVPKIPASVEPDGAECRLLELRERGQCRFPLWDKEMPTDHDDRLYCGKPSYAGNGEVEPYCLGHKRIMQPRFTG